MKGRYFVIGIGLLLAVPVSSAEADPNKQERRLRCTDSLTASFGVETYIDTNGDGLSANFNQGIVNCDSVRFFAQEEGEYKQPIPGDGDPCPVGTGEYHIQQGLAVLIEEKSGDQLFLQYKTDKADEAISCIAADLTLTYKSHGTITGGTGQFTGASGFFDSEGSGKYLVVGAKEVATGVFIPGGFGRLGGPSTITLEIPKK